MHEICCGLLEMTHSGTIFYGQCAASLNYTIYSHIYSIHDILEPLAIANNVTQAGHTRLDHVLLTLGNLFHIYSNPKLDTAIRTKILASLEKRWSAADQDVFILAVLFNPYIRHQCFSRSALSHADLYDMAERVYKRVFQKDADVAFLVGFTDYYNGEGEYSHERMKLDLLKEKYNNEVSFCFHDLGSKLTSYIRIAHLILLLSGNGWTRTATTSPNSRFTYYQLLPIQPRPNAISANSALLIPKFATN